jgi:TonB family protein
MASLHQRRSARVAAGALFLTATIAGTALYFAPPERETNLPGLPPLVLPKPGEFANGAAASTRPEVDRRTEKCDGGAEMPVAARPRPITPPQSWFSSDDYPMMAIMMRKQGITTTDLSIDTGGHVIGCGISGSSGHMTLDARTCNIFRERAHFTPAIDERGCPVPFVWHQRVRWQIPKF